MNVDKSHQSGPQPPELPRWMYLVYFVRGCVAFALGASLLLSDAGLSLLASFLAGYWIVASLLTLRWVAGNRVAPGRRVGVVVGVIGLAAGILLLLRRLLTSLIEEGLFLDFVGLTAVAMGLLRLTGRFHDDQLAGDRSRARYRVVVGTLDIVLGVAVILASEGTADDIRLTLGIWGLLTGTFLLLDALRLRRFERARRTAP